MLLDESELPRGISAKPVSSIVERMPTAFFQDVALHPRPVQPAA